MPEDLDMLKGILGIDHPIFYILNRTALKFQTVKTSVKGKNPGDFIEGLKENELIIYLKKLYTPQFRKVA